MQQLRNMLLILLALLACKTSFCWGFYAHKKINYYAVFLLPPEMMAFYKPHIGFITEHAVDPDKRRYASPAEGARHYIDIDLYGPDPRKALPQKWDSAIAIFTLDTLNQRGIVPWWIQTMLARLTKAFKEKNTSRILQLSAELGHYIADAHVPLHASSNHNGQLTNQQGIHAFWESRLPELLAAKEWDFFIGKAVYLPNAGRFIWDRVYESARAADTVLAVEQLLSGHTASDQRFAFEDKNGLLVRQYASSYARTYNDMLNGMVERRMRQSIFAIASCWYTAWIDAGQPDLRAIIDQPFSDADQEAFRQLDLQWKNAPSASEADDHRR